MYIRGVVVSKVDCRQMLIYIFYVYRQVHITRKYSVACIYGYIFGMSG